MNRPRDHSPFGWNSLPTANKLQLARLFSRVIRLARAAVLLRQIIRVQRRNVTFELDLGEGIDLAIYLSVYERDTYRALRRLVTNDATVLDIGANFGVHTLPLAEMVGVGGRVIAFEPTTYAFARLQRNLDLNPRLAPRVTAVKAYLGDGRDENRPVAFYARWTLDQEPRQHPIHGGSLEGASDAEAWTLDAYATAANIERIAVVKMDVDGFECKVLRGARAVLARDHPAIVCEICPYALEEHGDSLEDMLELLADLGYELFDERRLKPLALDSRTVRALIKPRSSVNVVALAPTTVATATERGFRP